jgi:hypothetical protein
MCSMPRANNESNIRSSYSVQPEELAGTEDQLVALCIYSISISSDHKGFASQVNWI